ncbi:MAG: hypothetical protein ABSH52_09105 [Terriglobia bacterium]
MPTPRPDVLSLGTMMLALPSQWLAILLALQIPAAPPGEVTNVELQPATVQAFNRYVQLTEARINQEVSTPDKFLYVDGYPPERRSQALAALQRGEVLMERLRTTDRSGQTIEAPGGLIHHWLGVVFVPGATLQQTLALMEDYNHHQDVYRPEVVRSRLLSRQDSDFKIFYRLRKKKVITVTLDTNHDVHYFPVDSKHWYSRSYSTRIAEVVGADTPDEREKPVGQDGGFLWRINSYWKFEEKDGGVYIECESISLTRDIPRGLGWLIKPFVTGIPKDSLLMTMDSTRAALEAGRKGN